MVGPEIITVISVKSAGLYNDKYYDYYDNDEDVVVVVVILAAATAVGMHHLTQIQVSAII